MTLIKLLFYRMHLTTVPFLKNCIFLFSAAAHLTGYSFQTLFQLCYPYTPSKCGRNSGLNPRASFFISHPWC